MQQSQANSAGQSEKSKARKVYKHPFHDRQNNPVVMGEIWFQRILQEAVGPEIVSPHYENFLMSRKWAIFTVVGVVTLGFFATHRDFHHFAASQFIPFWSWICFFYFFLEGRKSILKPLHGRFHSLIVDHEVKLFYSYWTENMRQQILSRINVAKEQIEYFSVHDDYHSVKAESINRFLAIEQINLKNHIQSRALRLLQTAEQMETANQRYLINNIVSDALKEVDRTLTDNIDQIQDAMFESALIGIKKQKMTYENDPLLPLIRKRIQDKIGKLTNMSEEEKQRLVSLSEDQIESLRVLDRQIRDEYIKKVPKLDNSIKAYPNVKKALETWGRA